MVKPIEELLLTDLEIMEKAAASAGLKISERCLDRGYSDTEPVGTCPVNEKLVSLLKTVGFTFEPGEPPRQDKTMYLWGHSHQDMSTGFESDAWSWKMEEKNPVLAIHFRLRVSERDRGILAIPVVWGNCSGTPVHRPTIDKLVMKIVEHDKTIHPLLSEMSDDYYPLIPWTSIGLGGIRRVRTLFDEFYGDNEFIMKLTNSNISPFCPDSKNAGSFWVPETEHRRLFRQWGKQLNDFKASLR